MAFYGIDEVDDKFCRSYASDDSRESDFHFDYDELEFSDEDSVMNTEDFQSINENYVADGQPLSRNELQF